MKIDKSLLVVAILVAGTLHAHSSSFVPSETLIYNENHPKPNIMLMIDQAKIGLDQKIENLTFEEKKIFGKYLKNTSNISKVDAIAAVYQKIIDDYGQFAHFGLAKVPDMSVTGYLRSDVYKDTNSAERDLSVIVYPILNGEEDRSFSGNRQKYSSKEAQHHDDIKKYLKNFSTNSILDEYPDNRAWLYSISEVFKYFWGSGYALDDRRLFRTDWNGGGGVVDYIRAEDKKKEIVDEKRIVYKTFGTKGSPSQDPIQYVCQKNLIIYSPVDRSKNYADYGKYANNEGYYDAPADIPMVYQYNVRQPGSGSGSTPYAGVDLNYSAIFNKDLIAANSTYLTYAKDPTWGHTLLWDEVKNANEKYTSTVASAFIEYFAGDATNSYSKVSSPWSLAVQKVNLLEEEKDLHGNSWKDWHAINKDGKGWVSDWARSQGYQSKTYDPANIVFSIISTGDAKGNKSAVNVFPLARGYRDDFIWKGAKKNGDELSLFISYYNGSMNRDPGDITSLLSQRTDFFFEPYARGGKGLTRNTFSNVYTINDDTITLTNLYNKINDDVRGKIFNLKNNGRYIYDQHTIYHTSPSVYQVTTTPYLWTSEISNFNNITPDINGFLRKDIYRRNYHSYEGYGYIDVPSFSTHYSIKPNQGEFFTSNDGHKDTAGFPDGKMGEWLRGKMDLDPKDYRFRDTPLGAIDNSSIVYTAKDHMYINLDQVGDRKRYIEKMYLKNKNFENNLLIAGSNDGLLNFIVGFRNSKGKELQRRASYLIPFFNDNTSLREITAPLYKNNLCTRQKSNPSKYDLLAY